MDSAAGQDEGDLLIDRDADEVFEGSPRCTTHRVDGRGLIAVQPDQRAVEMNVGCVKEAEHPATTWPFSIVSG